MMACSGNDRIGAGGPRRRPTSGPGPAPMITYTVKVMETEGIGWRESVLPT